MQTNIDVQAAIAKVEKYCLDTLNIHFPMIEIEALFNVDQDNDGDLTGLIAEKSGIVYQFVIEKDDPNPLLQRVVKDAK